MTEQEDRKYPDAGEKMREFYERAAKQSIAEFVGVNTGKLPDLIRALEDITKHYTLRVEEGLVVISFKYPAQQQHACTCDGSCSCKEGKA